ncbi:glycosyltransferase [Bifidobacterium vansinderenii]|uniref:Glycosyl transferase family 2 n=1 Tax=Bifidobacterium vansinderenii TaxID=1984871 RepID=A0A229VUX2_9BIFI|nr:glycosyltransferase [Bifidobacterium vansinderenii]OXM99408.1 glycosyl transferase family 2 [Bifidobacterium vansinderenii]
MPKISIIVPIYNVETYLTQCLESIRVQTFKDWECLMFSDGSKDGSLDIMKSFAAKDDRFKVIDKKNEGYGATCNRGLEMAQGEWISIIEPDDFIDPNMYARLLGSASSTQGTVDIIKSSYWLFYDGHDGYKDALLTPNLSNMMPQRRTEFTLNEFAEPFYHHPSIWSAIYRKAFLNGDNKAGMTIRFKPIPGAGWTDNPFFAQTMVLADRISWLPGKYYYYRQTNPGASSLLKDYRMPFDRLREMRAFLDTQDISDDVRHAFYSREFDYITSVIGEFGFDDKDEEIRSLIREVFDSMDRKEVLLMLGRLRPEFVDYYLDFMGESYEIHPHERPVAPELSIVLLTKDARSWIVDAFEAYSKFKNLPCEFVIVDAGSQDSTVNVARQFAAKDKRFTVRELPSDATMTELVDEALATVRGTYTMFIPSHFVIGEKTLRAALAGARRTNSDIALLDIGNIHCDYLIEKLLNKGYGTPESYMDAPENKRGPIYGPFSATDIPELAMASNRDYSWHKVYNTAFLKNHGFKADEHDIADNLLGLGAQALLATESLVFLDLKTDWDIRDIQRKQVGGAFWLSLEKIIPYTSEPETDIESVLAVGEMLRERGVYDTFEKSYLNMLLSSFMFGLQTRYTPERITEFLDTYLDKVAATLDIDKHGALYFYDTDAFNNFQKITFGGARTLDLWLEERALADEDGIFGRDKALEEIHRSARFRIGENAVNTMKRFAPSSLVATAQEKARLLKRG